MQTANKMESWTAKCVSWTTVLWQHSNRHLPLLVEIESKACEDQGEKRHKDCYGHRATVCTKGRMGRVITLRHVQTCSRRWGHTNNQSASRFASLRRKNNNKKTKHIFFLAYFFGVGKHSLKVFLALQDKVVYWGGCRICGVAQRWRQILGSEQNRENKTMFYLVFAVRTGRNLYPVWSLERRRWHRQVLQTPKKRVGGQVSDESC